MRLAEADTEPQRMVLEAITGIFIEETFEVPTPKGTQKCKIIGICSGTTHDICLLTDNPQAKEIQFDIPSTIKKEKNKYLIVTEGHQTFYAAFGEIKKIET